MDTKLLFLQRFTRLFAYGGSTLILVLYLSALDISYRRIGFFMTLTLIGDLLISFCLTLVADSLGRRTILALGAALMAISGVIFAVSGDYWVLLVAAIFGVISPSGNEIGPFRAIEESIVAHLSAPEVRGDIYAWYALFGAAGSAFGLMTCGWAVHHLKSSERWSDIQAYRMIFYAYAVLGIIKLALTLALSSKVEVESVEPLREFDPETAPLLGNSPISAAVKKTKKQKFTSLFPLISAESRIVVFKLCLLFALDALAGGLVPLSWMTIFFQQKFNLEEGALGTVFSTTALIGALSSLVASSIARRIGNIKAMVFTHLPSSILLALIPIPNQFPAALLFLVLRSCTATMDVAPRSAFLAAVILPNERTAVMGLINLVKTFGLSIGHSVTGFAAENKFWMAFVLAGTLKSIYDLGVLAMFAGHVTRDDRAKAAAEAAAVETPGESQVMNGHAEEPTRRAP